MATKAFLAGLSIILLAVMAATPQGSLAAEKVRLGNATRIFYPYVLPYLAAEEKGLWKESGLAAELFPFAGAGPLNKALAAGHIDVGMNTANSVVDAAAAGVPQVVVANLITKGAGFYMWIRGDSPLKEARDFKSGQIAVSSFGSGSHISGRVVAKALGIEKEIKFVAAGDGPTMIGLVRAGRVVGSMNTIGPAVNLMAAGELRSLLAVADYLPKPWLEQVILARTDFLNSKPELVKKTVKILTEGSKFLKERPDWTLKKLKDDFFLSDKAARIAYDNLIVNIEIAKIDRGALENVKNFMVEYGLLSKERAPATDSFLRNILD